MKIKVDAKEYKELLERVEKLEEFMYERQESLYRNWMITEQNLEEMMERYFSNKCMTVVMKRNEREIVARVRKRFMDHIEDVVMKEEKYEED